ncbi:hypothetical protein SLA2020_255660 [Shorea laevis]
MAQYRQQYHYANGSSDHVGVGIRSSVPHKSARWRRSARGDKSRRLSIGSIVVVLSLVLVVTVLVYYYISSFSNGKELNNYYHLEYDDSKNDRDFLANVTRKETSKVLKFGHGSGAHGRDSRYWDRDDRRRDEDYNEDEVDQSNRYSRDESLERGHSSRNVKNENKVASRDSVRGSDRRGVGLYNEAGRHELRKYEAEYEASLKNVGHYRKENGSDHQQSDKEGVGMHGEENDADDQFDDGIDFDDLWTEEYNDSGHGKDTMDEAKSHDRDGKESSSFLYNGAKDQNVVEEVDEASNSSEEASSLSSRDVDVDADSQHAGTKRSRSSRPGLRRKTRGRKFSGSSCEMKLLNSTAQLVEPLESRKFARFSLQYTEMEEKLEGEEPWEPRFAGHQSLHEREESFLARDQKINCGFVKGPKGSPSTGFDLAEDDVNYISRCHIAVISCIFGNSDRLRVPGGKTVTRLSRKNVCFVMFMDEMTSQTLFSEGHLLDRSGFIGLWKIVVVKNLPYCDMRRVGKIPKMLPHRLFPSARYSIWLDSKLRLQRDPLLILEYFLWRKGHEYAISNHYDRHCMWEEVARNKKLNKYNHTVIDEQFAFYQADGLTRFNASDPNKLLPSNVPEGSFIVRAHTPMSNLFSCLWFNEVDRFTSRDQLSFAYTYQKLRKMNPGKPFYLNMFKDCERRIVTKLFRHRSDEKRNVQQQVTL